MSESSPPTGEVSDIRSRSREDVRRAMNRISTWLSGRFARKHVANDKDAFEQGFHGVPNPELRAVMSPEKLAIELSKLEQDSPPYILLEHELNLRLAKEQAKATLNAGWLGAVSTLFAVVLAFVLGLVFEKNQHPDGQQCAKPSVCQDSPSNGKDDKPAKASIENRNVPK